MIMHDRASSEMRKFKPANDVYFTPHLNSLPDLQKNQMLKPINEGAMRSTDPFMIKKGKGDLTTHANTIQLEEDPSMGSGERMNANSSMGSLPMQHRTVGGRQSSFPKINAKNSQFFGKSIGSKKHISICSITKRDIRASQAVIATHAEIKIKLTASRVKYRI